MTISPQTVCGEGKRKEKDMKKKRKTRDADKKHPKTMTQTEAPTTPPPALYERKRMEVAVVTLKPAPWNPRGEITPESVSDLVGSIKSLGVIEPLVAMENMTLISGHRRLAAAKLVGLETVSCDVLVGVDDMTARRMTIIENLQRKDADPLLESELVGSLAKSGMTQTEIAAETGRGREWVARRMNLVNLSKSWRRRVADGEQITTDCLEHVASYPANVQERLKGARGYNNGSALRWYEIRNQFYNETCNLNGAKFDRKPCKTCPNNTGCAPDLFDWDGRVTAFGRCLDPKCYRGRIENAIEKAKADAKKDGLKVVETKDFPVRASQLQDRREAGHDTLFVWTDYGGQKRMQWGKTVEPPKGADCAKTDEEQKEERRRKIAAGKARRKLAEWCRGNLAGVIARRYQIDVQTARAFQTLFDIGSSWCVFGTTTNATDAALTYLLDVCKCGDAPKGQWARMAAPEIAAKIRRSEIGGIYAERLLAILPEAETALTAEERRLVVSDDKLAKLREPVHIKWTEGGTYAEAEDAAMQGGNGEEDGEAAE